MKKEITTNASLILLTGLYCLIPAPSFANQSAAYKAKADCIENPDFVTPKEKTFKYCIKKNGVITTINQDEELVEEEARLDKTLEEQTRKGWRNTTTHLSEYKVEEDEFVQYKCTAKKVGSKYECDGSSERILKGVRPDEYYLNQGLKKVEDEKWKGALEDFTSEIDLSKNKEAYYQRAFAKLMLEDYLGSIKDANSNLKADKNNIKAYNLRSMAKYEIEDHKGAIRDLNKFIVLWEKLSEEERLELEIEEINPIHDKFYYRRALSKSETGDQRGAIKDFDQAIENHPLHGQAYFQKGLEQYWTSRDDACADLLKGMTLGAKDTSGDLIKERAGSDSFLDELFGEEKTLVDACQDSSGKKIQENKGNYEFEQFKKKAFELGRKYVLLAPIFLLIIIYLVAKYSGNDDDDE